MFFSFSVFIASKKPSIPISCGSKKKVKTVAEMSRERRKKGQTASKKTTKKFSSGFLAFLLLKPCRLAFLSSESDEKMISRGTLTK